MPVSMTGTIDRVEVITSVQRRRRWSAEEKATIVQETLQETYAPGMSVSLVARRHGIAPNQLFRWRRLYAEGASRTSFSVIAIETRVRSATALPRAAASLVEGRVGRATSAQIGHTILRCNGALTYDRMFRYPRTRTRSTLEPSCTHVEIR